MKAHICLLLLVCLSLPARAENTPKLEVHEWGTFTVLSGSDGIPVDWYQGAGFADGLPSFVQFNPFGSKAAFGVPPSLVRMETPVIYFYPEKPLHVTVNATFIGGQLTEWFPAAKPSPPTLAQPLTLQRDYGLNLTPPALPPAGPVTWEGDLFPPVDAAALSQIPQVPAGVGEHYRHAREVPQAWIFRGTRPSFLPPGHPAIGQQAEKFIFYRGRGQATPPYNVQPRPDGSLTLRHRGDGGAIVTAFALTVKNGTAQWSSLAELPGTKAGDAPSYQAEAVARMDTPAMPVERAAEELAAAIRTSLAAAGLTPDEASAMVATWHGHWFREPGTRVLAILPQNWVDSVLPLKIEPSPARLTRVFVARFEVLTPARESEMIQLIKGDSTDVDRVARFRDLQLGRFIEGALVRAQRIENERMREQMWKLQQEAVKGAKETAAR